MDTLNASTASPDSAVNPGRGLGRLSRFTRNVRLLRWAVAVLIAWLAVQQFAGATQKEDEVLRTTVVTAEKYELLGPNGKTAAMLYRGDDGLARLVFVDEKGALRLFVGVNPDGTPAIIFMDEKGKQRIRIGSDLKQNSNYLYLFDNQERVTISLSTHQARGPYIVVGRDDTGRASMGLTRDGEPQVTLFAKNNEPRLSMELTRGAPSIRLYDEAKAVRATWKLSADGSPSFSILDEQSKPRLSIGAEKDQHPYVRFLDRDGRIIESLPRPGA